MFQYISRILKVITLTYVPPEKKQSGSSGFADFLYVVMFYLIEISFIFIGIPVIILALGFVPIAMYLIITEGGTADDSWIFYLFGVVIVFFQILGLQYFFKRWILEPNKMTFGEWLKWKFSPTEIRKRRDERRMRSERMDKWYDSMGKIKETEDRIKEEQALDLRTEWFKNSGNPEILLEDQEADKIIFGETFEDDTFTIETESIQSEKVELDSEEDNYIIIESEEKPEEDDEEEESYTY